MLKKGLSVLLALVVMLSAFAVLPLSASAEKAPSELIASGVGDPDNNDPTEPTVPDLDIPVITSCESLDSGVKINWNAVPGAEKYRVYFKYGTSWRRMGTVSADSFIDEVVKSGGTYTYTVRCVNAADDAYTSDYDKTGFTYTYNMATPQITGMTSSASGVTINWNAVDNAKKYSVFYKNGKGSWVKMANVTGTSYTDSDVRFGKTYTYTVRCIKSDGSRYTSSYKAAGWTHKHYLDTPRIYGCESLVNGVRIKWNAVPNAQKYRVFYKTGSGGWKSMGETSGTSFVDDVVRAGKAYTYTVRCITNDLSAYMSDYAAAGYTYTYNPQLAAPKLTGCSSTIDGVRITWNAVSGASIYRVFYKGSDGWIRLADTTAVSYTDSTIPDGATRTYTVRCLTTNKKDYASSYDKTGIQGEYLPYPVLTNAYMSGSDLYVNIKDSSDAASYRVWKLTSSGYTYIGDINSKSGLITDIRNESGQDVKRVIAGNTYTFIVQGYDADGEACTDFYDNGFRFTV